MSTATRSALRTTGVAVRAMVVATVVLGVVYTLVITGVGQLAMPWQSNGSMLTGPSGRVVGSALLGQSFTDAKGHPLPRYFQPRLSAAGKGYDGRASGGSNLGPNDPALVTTIEAAKTSIAAFDGVAPSRVPADAVTASASGLDPDISVAYALIQVDRVAAARGLSDAVVRGLVASHVLPRDLGFLGEPRVNVLELNLALDRLRG